MNENNLKFLKDNLEKLGFGTQLNDPLEKLIITQQPDIVLKCEAERLGEKVDYELHFRKSSSSDMYFFNRYTAGIDKGEESRVQSFNISGVNNVHAGEAFNLIAGRPVQKELYTQDGERYEAWLKLDFSSQEKYGFKMESFSNKYGFDLEKTLEKFPIKELDHPEYKAQLLSELKAGDLVTVHMQKEGQDIPVRIEPNLRWRTLVLRDTDGKSLKRESFEKKPERALEDKLSDAIKKGKHQENKVSQNRGMSI